MQFHAKYPLFDSQSEREFTFSYAILYKIQWNILFISMQDNVMYLTALGKPALEI